MLRILLEDYRYCETHNAILYTSSLIISKQFNLIIVAEMLRLTLTVIFNGVIIKP